MKKTLLTLAGATLLSMSAQAEQFWADNSISVLQGSDYEFTDTKVTTTTLEHVSGHSWGGVFLFVDRHNSTNHNETYAEVSPKFTLVKMDGIVSSINAAFTYEYGAIDNQFFSASFDNYLYGVGADLNIPGLNFNKEKKKFTLKRLDNKSSIRRCLAPKTAKNKNKNKKV